MNCNPVATGWEAVQELKPPAAAQAPRCKLSQVLRKVHLWMGIVFTINFLILLLTGFLVQHRGWLALETKTVTRKWLPSGYRPGDPDEEIRADIVLTDLHSGKLFGPKGPLVVDAAAAAWLFMMSSGYGVQLLARYRNGKKT